MMSEAVSMTRASAGAARRSRRRAFLQQVKRTATEAYEQLVARWRAVQLLERCN